MTERPYMQLYIADYLGDTQHLTIEQSGCYLHLLMAMWRAGGYLPNDATKLARVVRLTVRKWKKLATDVMPLFTIEGDRITQKRLLFERKKVTEFSAKQRDNVSRRYLKNKDEAPTKALPNGYQKPTRARVPFPLPNKEEEKHTPLAVLATVLDEERAKAVIEHRKKRRAPLTAHAAKLLAGKFAKCPNANDAADAMIANGWQGFEPQWLDNRSQGPPRGKQLNGGKLPEFKPEKPIAEISGEERKRRANLLQNVATKLRGT